MDDIFSDVSALLHDGQPVEHEISISTQQAQALDLFVQAMAGAGGQPVFSPEQAARLTAGLTAVSELAGQGFPPAASVNWACLVWPLPDMGKMLTLKQLTPSQVEMGFQVERSRRLYGQFYISLGGQTAFFYLARGSLGWVLHGNQGQPFEVALPPDVESIPWNSEHVMAFQNRLGVIQSGAPLFAQKAAQVLAQAVPDVLQTISDSHQEAAVSLPAQPGQAAILLVVEGTGQRLTVQAALAIGRGRDNHLCLEGKSLSRNHAVIEPVSGGWQVRDLHSTNGTWLNGARVDGAARLAEGDVIGLGRTRVKVIRIQA